MLRSKYLLKRSPISSFQNLLLISLQVGKKNPFVCNLSIRQYQNHLCQLNIVIRAALSFLIVEILEKLNKWIDKNFAHRCFLLGI